MEETGRMVVLITGCAAGPGLELAALLAKKNARVYATVKDMSQSFDLLKKARENDIEESSLLIGEVSYRKHIFLFCSWMLPIGKEFGNVLRIS